MEITAPAGAPAQTGIPFYERPEPLNNEAHANLGIRTESKPYGFAAGAKSLPIAVTEFMESAANYPIIFSVGENPMPMVVTGLAEGRNLFVYPDGSYQVGAYIPAYVRRFPFVVAEDTESERLVVCIERATSLVSEDGDIRLFENGEATAYTNNCVAFCTRFEEDRRRTQAFSQYIKSLDLFEMREITQPVFRENGEHTRLPLTTVNTISEKKLAELPAATLAEMRDNGALIQIYAHLVSQVNWDKLMGMRADREVRGIDPTGVQ